MQQEQVTYIATATENGEWLEVRMLASNSIYPQHVGRCKTTDECRELVKKFGQVTWVTPYRFMKEATCY